MRRVVVTGIGIVSPLGVGASASWQNLIAGQCAISRLTAFDPSAFACQLAGQAPSYKISDFVPKSYRKATKVLARDIELAIVAADNAFKSSGILSKAYTDSPSFNSDRFGCNIGAGLISAELNELTAAFHAARNGDVLDMKKWGTDGMQQLTPLWLLKYLPNMLACHVTIVHGLKGPSNTITCADSSGHLAIGEAFRTVQRGDADFAICGGAQSRTNPMAFMRQTLLKRLNTTSNDQPALALRPFDAAAAGSIPGEGGGLLILEEYEQARARGAKIYCELAGFGASQDAYSISDPDPSGLAYGSAIAKALADAGVKPAEVSCLIPCGTAKPSHDRAEMAGLQKAFGAALSDIPMALPKSQTGHLEAGSAVEVAFAALAIANDTVPPAINTTSVAGGHKLNLSVAARQQPVNVAVSSVWSIGGQNAALVFRRI
jgi:3-oxoacyl-[acyl-carrier-protein] synthase II